MTTVYLPLEGTNRLEALGNILWSVGQKRQVKIECSQGVAKHSHFVFRPSGEVRLDGRLIDEMSKALSDSGLDHIGLDISSPAIHPEDCKTLAGIEKISLLKLDDSEKSKSFVKALNGKNLTVAMINCDTANAGRFSEIMRELTKCKSLKCLSIDARKFVDPNVGKIALDSLSKIEGLVLLDLYSKPQTLDSFSGLGRLKSLRWLDVTCPTSGGKPCVLEDVQKSLPGIDVLLRDAENHIIEQKLGK